jgi:TonB family protein
MLDYLLESSCCWVLLYAFYALFLRREQRFGYNRAYLLLALLLGILAPWLSVDNPVASVWLAPVDLSDMAGSTLKKLAQAATPTAAPSFLVIVYSLGVLGFAGRFVGGLYRIWRLYRRSQVERTAHYRLVTMSEAYPPFSFANCLFVPKHLAQDSEAYQCIVTHEAAHIQQAHSLDVLLVELLQIVCWFNPILILYKMALRDQHEYLADQAVLRNTSVAQYGHLLLDQSVSTVLPLVHPFFHSSLKKRIIMMTTTSKRMPVLKYALSILACVFTVGLVACQKPNPSTTVEKEVDTMPYLASCESDSRDEQTQCSNKTLLTYIYDHVKYPEAAKKAKAEGMAVLDFVVQTDGRIGAMKIVRSTKNDALDAEALRVLAQLKEDGALWKPGTKDGKAVNVSYKLPLRFKLQ